MNFCSEYEYNINWCDAFGNTVDRNEPYEKLKEFNVWFQDLPAESEEYVSGHEMYNAMLVRNQLAQTLIEMHKGQ